MPRVKNAEGVNGGLNPDRGGASAGHRALRLRLSLLVVVSALASRPVRVTRSIALWVTRSFPGRQPLP
jgi:hypothetical protein